MRCQLRGCFSFVFFKQVDCDPPGSIVVNVDTYRPTEGGYLRLDLQQVAGTGALAGVGLRKSTNGVRCIVSWAVHVAHSD